MSNERYDVVLKALNGPLAAMGEQKFQGPLVRVGTNPGPGGFALTGYRGVDARQAVITAYGEGEATVGPVGTNQVRMAPHPHVNWKDIDPLTGPEYLNDGAAIHLGPVGRGCTIEFVRVEKLGVWTQGRVGSAADNVQAVEVSAPVAAKRAAPRRSAARIAAATLPIGIVGCLGVSVAVVAAVLIIVVYVQGPKIDKLGPVVEGEEYYESVDPDDLTEKEKEALKGLKGAFERFHAQPSADQAKQAGATSVDHITDPERWDQNAYKYFTASVAKHAKSKSFFRRLNTIREEYAQVLGQVREAGLPEAIASIPYTESRYKPEIQSWACAKGFWQFMPEVAYRIEKKNGLDFRVRNCRITTPSGQQINWSPDALAPPNRVRTAPYIDGTREGYEPDLCLIPPQGGCAIDDRADLRKSTAAAIVSLKEAWDDRDISESGGAAVMTIISHNAGYLDSRFGINKSYNVLPAFKDWSKKKSPDEYHLFYGDNIKCKDKHAKGFCGSELPQEAQHYGYTVLAQHTIAACYYGENYGNQFPQYREWDSLLDGYCEDFRIPTSKMVERF